MGRGLASPGPTPLPKVSFMKVYDDASTQPTGVHDLQARSYGYNDFSEFKRPEHYIRYIEPLESELAVQVEYDMDEQDQEWLDAVNAERKRAQLDNVSYEIFEIVMDRLEKEWFDLTKNIPKPDMALPSEDSTCAICDDSEGENTNAIVFCDGCNLAVHQDCYGVPYIPEGQWLCRKCTVSPENPVSCILCPNEGGAFKQTVHGEWVHLLCAIWIPETHVANDVFMEPITGVDKISKQRWKLKCSICDIREGACIQCTKASCFLAFHATCARKEKLLMPMKASQGSEAPTLAAYCEKHLPKEQQEIRASALAAEEGECEALDDKLHSPKSSKTARAYAKTYKPGPPLVPHIIVERIMQYIGKVGIRHKREFVLLVCKYWSLKREARRGAAFLKRLHLEPWTASSGGMQQTDEEKAIKLEYMKCLRQDLESLRMLAELSRKRESRKREQTEIIQDVFNRFLFAHEPSLRMAFEKIVGSDRHEYFKNPVSRVDVPDYYDIIKRPMNWNVIDRKLDRHEYLDLQNFKDDVNLVLDNAMIYNRPGTPFFKAAQRIKASAEPVMADLDRIASSRIPDDELEDGKPASSRPTFGNLEPPLRLLDLLLSESAIKDDIDLILDKEPLEYLFSYESPKFKPKPPPPPPKPRRNRKADLERKRLERLAATRGQLDASPGFRAPRTRRARAVVAAFEAEVAKQDVISGGPESVPSGEGIGAEGVPLTGPKARSKRASAGVSGHAEHPPMLETVDNQQSFSLFDKGWILPPDQRRGNRPPIERHPLPPPRKKAKTARGKSHLSTFSTSAADNETLRSTPPPETYRIELPVVPQFSDEIMNADQLQVDLSQMIWDQETGEQGDALLAAPMMPIIIEELDTPATRREKNMRRKQEKTRLAAAAAIANPIEATTKTSTSLAAQPSWPEKQEDGSDLSSLSELSEEELEGEESGIAEVTQSQRRKTIEVEPGAVVVQKGETLEGGTLVWAKADSYPWWPAVVFESDDPHVPKSVLHQKNDVTRTEHGSLHLVRFFDRQNSWQWVELNRLKMLGENDTLDDELLAPTSRMQRWKNSHIRQECRQAYRRAMAERETDGDGDDSDFKDNETRQKDQIVSPGAFKGADSPMTEVEA
ncbi:hypothetical protein AcW1_006473 [Taiwanofungus camphoratus]|nr:hypothetical protein AcW2_005235 [Antrodia cinnamomea]KAI0940828.1 hypothetical protein AcV7_003102 [Antrodia cinnamomea]KAI0954659.1 hypothetical protein AcW1_006473 [Antrodia cinnamomea]